MSCVKVQYIDGDECIGASLPKINGNFATLSSAVCELSGSVAVRIIDSPTVDLSWNTTSRTLSANIFDSAITSQKLAYEGGSFSFRNKIINGGFDFWQRGETFTDIGPNTFTADRWTTSTVSSNNNKNISRQLLQSSDLPSVEAGLRYFLRASHSSGVSPTETGIYTPLELTTVGNASPFKVGKVYTLSYYARCVSPNPIGVHVQFRDIGSGSGSSNDNTVVLFGSPRTLTTNWARYTSTFVMLSPNPTNVCLLVGFTNRSVTATKDIDITGVQLEEGPTATPFEIKPYGVELSLCQRYYHKITPGSNNKTYAYGYNTTPTQGRVLINFPVTLRSTPTLEQTGLGTDYKVRYGGQEFVLSQSPEFGDATILNGEVIYTVNGGLSSGYVSTFHATNSASYIAWNAEL